MAAVAEAISKADEETKQKLLDQLAGAEANLKNQEALQAEREAARMAPDERLLVETDSPYLSPVPLRGRRCEPGYVAHTVAALADLRGVSRAEAARITADNARWLFRL